MNATTKISDEIQPLTSSELEDISGSLLHAGFTLGCVRYDIVASANEYIVIQTTCSCS